MWRKVLSGDFSRTCGVDGAGTLSSGVNYENFYPQARGDESLRTKASFPHPTCQINPWGIAVNSPHIWGESAAWWEVKLDELSPNHTLYPQFFASYPHFGAVGSFSWRN